MRMVSQPLIAPVGYTQASRVSLVVRSRLFESGTTTLSFKPSKTRAVPYFPLAVQVGPLVSVPLLLFPDWSIRVVPAPALKLYEATKPVGAPGVTGAVGVAVEVGEAELVSVSEGVAEEVGVLGRTVGVNVGVLLEVAITVGVEVNVDAMVGEAVNVFVLVNVNEGCIVGVLVGVGPFVAVAVNVEVGDG